MEVLFICIYYIHEHNYLVYCINTYSWSLVQEVGAVPAVLIVRTVTYLPTTFYYNIAANNFHIVCFVLVAKSIDKVYTFDTFILVIKH